MFKQKMVVEVDLNELIEQVKRGERAVAKLSAITAFLDEKFYNMHEKFVGDLSKGNEKEFYSWYYPFEVFDSSVKELANVMGYKMSEEMCALREEDLQKAIEYNKSKEEAKENE